MMGKRRNVTVSTGDSRAKEPQGRNSPPKTQTKTAGRLGGNRRAAIFDPYPAPDLAIGGKVATPPG